MMDDDEDFENMMVECFGVSADGYEPSAPDYIIPRAGNAEFQIRAPKARQVHGDCIAWRQEESTLERLQKDQHLLPQKKVMGCCNVVSVRLLSIVHRL